MRALSLAIAAAVSLASAGLAFAASDRVTDSQYLAAARCSGLAEGTGQSADAFDAFLKAQSKGRSGNIADRADVARDKARHAAKIANETQKSTFAQELRGACAAYTAG
jgi:hypothetical protein